MRPPLTKELWYQNDDEKVKNLIFRTYGGKERTIFFEKEGYFFEPKELESNEHGGTALALGLKVSKIDVDDQIVYFDNGQKIKYEKCLIATGGTPKNLEIFKNAPPPISQKVLLFRTVEDFNKLNDLVHKVQSIVIVGGGFLGSELACALGKKSAELKSFKVIQVFPEKGNLGLVLPEYLSKFATEKIKQEGAEILAERKIHQASYDKTADKVLLTLDDNSEISADLVVVAVGLDANIDLAKASDLEVDPRLGGFLVNSELEARSNLWAAGDAACFYDVRLGRRRVEHHDHAVVSGRLAGMNMTGARKPYKHQSMIWSDIGPYIGFEAIGLIDSALPTVSVFAKLPNSSTPDTNIDDAKSQDSEKTDPNPQIKELTLEETSSKLNSLDDDEYRKGIVFYLKDDVVVGVLMWNVFSGMSVARQIIQESRKFDDYAEVAKLFHLFYKPEDEDDKDKTKEPDQTETKAKKEVGEGAGFYVGR
ncbi:hypothetical protein HELRODRAFT_67025 [Helobdella robusta]|uniref:Uncharacterized protein n=1 Tax=Helobdella robusta TaxID=6412 RepID=T1FYV3_HELRO|nr:hypothetical protein HELRODRAFT_67025 [Helobdella robusta]ESN98758.1 hypothetical protein HELRODRAFT_67025 [Helobdella robusta]